MATSTCGELDPVAKTPFREMYCSLSGATAYDPQGPGVFSYNYQEGDTADAQLAELRIGNAESKDNNVPETSPFIQVSCTNSQMDKL